MIASDLTYYRTIVESAPNMIWMAGKTAKCCYFNQTWLDFTGRTMREELGDGWVDGVHPDDLRRCLSTFKESFQARQPFEMEYRLRRYDGRYRWINDRGVPIHQDGRFMGYLGSCIDVTDRVEGRLLKEMERLDRLDLAGQMAISLGHEIRNPMTTVRGYLQYYGSKPEFMGYKDQFDLMISELDHVNAIITEFLYLAKTKRTDKTLVNPNSLLTTIGPLISSDALRRGLMLKMDLGDLPDLLMDEKEIRQLIHNLVRNGFEAMGAGGCLHIATFAMNQDVVITVRDEGKGIPAEILPKIGTPFVTTKDQGTGLGLAVCYRIAERHQATIDVKTGPTGTTFSVKFPRLGLP